MEKILYPINYQKTYQPCDDLKLNEIPSEPFDNKLVCVLSKTSNGGRSTWLRDYLFVHKTYYEKIIIVLHSGDYIFKYVPNLTFVEEKSTNKNNIVIDANEKTLLIFNYDHDRNFNREKYVHYPNLTIMYKNIIKNEIKNSLR